MKSGRVLWQYSFCWRQRSRPRHRAAVSRSVNTCGILFSSSGCVCATRFPIRHRHRHLNPNRR